MPDAVSWRRVPARQVITELRRLNSGRWPRTYQDCETIAAGLHWRLVPQPRVACQEAYADARKHVIFLPWTTDDVEMTRQALHELSEIITDREGGEPEYWYQSPNDESHSVARLVESLCSPGLLRSEVYNVADELPPPPGDTDAPPPEICTLTQPATVSINSLYEGALAMHTLERQEADLLRQLEQIRQTKRQVREGLRKV